MATAGPASQDDTTAAIRARIVEDPALVLDDAEVLRALAEAGAAAAGDNVVDLRGLAMARLEERLSRLEGTHRAVIGAAYENQAATAQVHRAVLRLSEEIRFEGFLEALAGEVTDILRLVSVRLVLESDRPDGAPPQARAGGVLDICARGTVEAAFVAGRAGPVRRPIVLRETPRGGTGLHGARAAEVRSEALLRLDLGEGRLPGLLVLGSGDARQFRAGQATDLLGFFAGMVERAMRRYLG
ncbi:DUF484 family protein [Rhodobaculum claviforme]|uniref:DUF484 family protein n=1 Tax=Rhodobaculum claviforme TaxID=1549854 RepID=A0A934WIJ8_9RHOB|nr:DUF484 family protein [Rhodobaculum claviforme]MBK5926638.1 hypothetical protein [Rhodobaculum claviforme]